VLAGTNPTIKFPLPNLGLNGFGQAYNPGVAVGEGVPVAVGNGVLVLVGVRVLVEVGVVVGVLVGVWVMVLVAVLVKVLVIGGVDVAVLVAVAVGVLCAVSVEVAVGVLVAVLVAVFVAVLQPPLTVKLTVLELSPELVTLLAFMVKELLIGNAVQPTVPHHVTGHPSITEAEFVQTSGPLGPPEAVGLEPT
jgi:hypothetical protein